MKKIITIIILVLQAQFLSSQNSNFGNYYMMMNRVNVYLSNKTNHLKAAKILDSSLVFNGIPDYNFSGALVNYNLKRYESSYRHILKYAVSGNAITTLINNHPDSSGYKFRKQDLDFMLNKYPKLNNIYKSIQQKALLKVNLTFNNELIKLIEKDQAIRTVYGDFIDNIDTCCSEKAKIQRTKEFYKMDSLVYTNFKSLIYIHGLPTKSTVTFDGFSGFYFILMHGYTNSFSYNFCDSILKIAKQKLKQELFLTPQEYALIIDRYYINEKKINFYCEYNDSEFPIIEPKRLNSRRSEVFLPEIELPK